MTDIVLFQDPRFNRQIDGKTGYKTDSLVCMPVCNYDGEVIGVAQGQMHRAFYSCKLQS
jgi:hypothetical protein